MSPVRILVSQARETRLAEAIAAGIATYGNDVALVGDTVWPIQASMQLGPTAAITILIGPAADIDDTAAALQRCDRAPLVVRIVTAGESDGTVGPEQITELISMLCALTPAAARASDAHPLSFELRAESAFPQQSRLVETAPDQGILNQVSAWLDAVLRTHLQRSADAGDDLPGLSVSRDTIEQLLTNTSVLRNAEQDTTQMARAAAEEKLFPLLDEHASPAEPLAILCSQLRLTKSDICAFMLCLAPELDARYQRIFGFIHDDLSRRNATLGLIAAVLGDAVATRVELAVSNRLFDWQLVHTADQCPPHADAALRVDPALVGWLLGHRPSLLREPGLAALLRDDAWPGAHWFGGSATASAIDALEQALHRTPDQPRWLILTGDDSCAWRAMLELAATRAHTPLLRIRLDALGEQDTMNERLMRLARAARLLGRRPVFDASALERSPALTATLQRVSNAFTVLPLTPVLIARDMGCAIDAFPAGAYQIMEQHGPATDDSLLDSAAREAGLALKADDIALLAAAYPLPLDGLERALHLAAARGACGQSEAQQAAAVGAACHLVACPQLPLFATRLAPSFALDDLVLPQDRRLQLDELVAHVSFANTVLNTWGFGAQLPYGRGVAALFSGPSGTGKTMAARAIGHALQRSVFAVDLSRVLSKYIGEMEKNLHALFTEAEKAGAILLFDEADALFGKRSETKDAHDRYANIETAYLLQRIEAFSGLAILTTNFGQNLDRAFLRRLRFVIDFPLPGAVDRETIWRQCLPADAPLASDIDLAFLARRVEISGGHIRQITLRAAFAAASQRAPIGMGHLLRATRAEAIKLGMPALERELAELAVAA